MPKPSAAFLPINLPPVLIDRVTAAAYVGVGATLFDDLVAAGDMPPPRQLGERRKGWLVRELNHAADALPAAVKPHFEKAS